MATRRYLMYETNGQREVRIETRSNGRSNTRSYMPGSRGYNRALRTAQRVGQGGTVSSGG